ncbi:MAG: phosphoribosyltransferase domain-containing protein [Anaerolineaceae bacterium]
MSVVYKQSITNFDRVRTVELPTGLIEVKVESTSFPLDDLIGFAARANSKRGFLFLSKVLGKHWPVTPKLMQKIHENLVFQIPEDLPGPIVFIAMAETAIGLGQGVFETYKATHPERLVMFLHTTRYHVSDLPIIEFEEAHSHAPRQFLHLPKDNELQETLFSARSLVLIDDEASTGNTFLNLTAACRALNPSIEHVHLATITNFMGSANNDNLSERFGLNVTTGSSLSGEYKFTASNFQVDSDAAQVFEENVDRGASLMFGRVGVVDTLNNQTDLAQRLVNSIGVGERTLVLGTGEFMHIPFLLGLALENHGVDVFVQSTTRSPILHWGAVTSALTFDDNYGEGVANFLYNVELGEYKHIFICHETPPNQTLYHLANLLGGRLLHFISENQVEEISIY